MRLSRPVVALARVGLLGLAAIGAGAGATFTTDVKSSQTVTAGTLDVSVTADGSSCAVYGAHGCHELTLPAVGPVGSTFETPATHVFMTNTGNIPAVFDAIQMTESHNPGSASSALRNQMNVCIKSTDHGEGPWVEGNGPLTTAINLNPTVQENPVVLQPHEVAEYWVSFYAGKDSSECGTTTSDGSHTRDAWQGLSGVYETPASLTNAAQGGVVTPTLKFSFTG